MEQGLKMKVVKAAARLTLAGASLTLLASCGGGGGDPGRNNDTIAANRFALSVQVSPTTSLFYEGTNSSLDITLAKQCSGADCGNLPLDSVANQVITLSPSNANAVTFTPSQVITDGQGRARVTVNAANRDVSGRVDITASATLSGYTYRGKAVFNVNNVVDRTITAADHQFLQDVNFSTDCFNYKTEIVNVKDSNGIVQQSAVITNTTNIDGEGFAKDLGVFGGLGRVWLLQARPDSATCDTSGDKQKKGIVAFDVALDNPAVVYQIGYSPIFKTK